MEPTICWSFYLHHLKFSQCFIRGHPPVASVFHALPVLYTAYALSLEKKLKMNCHVASHAHFLYSLLFPNINSFEILTFVMCMLLTWSDTTFTIWVSLGLFGKVTWPQFTLATCRTLAMGWVISPPNSYVEALLPNVMLFEDGAFRR